MYKKAILLFIIVLISGCAQEKEFPEIKQEFEVQGLYWSSFSYYFEPGCYEWAYNEEQNQRVVEKARNAGANFLIIRAFYNGSEDGGIIGNTEEAKSYIKEAVKTAHKNGLGILLTPYLESREYQPSDYRWKLDEDKYTKLVLEWAGFAEENDIEMFSPGVEMNLIMEDDVLSGWFKEILPKIRDVYNGKITTIEQPGNDEWRILDENDVFEGYDCIGMTCFPWKEYEDGKVDIRSFEDYNEYVIDTAELVDDLADKYNINCTMVVPLGTDFWHGEYPNPNIISQSYEIGLDTLKEHDITGVFLHLWSSEHDHLGKNKEVEEMLNKRWTNTR